MMIFVLSIFSIAKIILVKVLLVLHGTASSTVSTCAMQHSDRETSEVAA